MFTKRLIASLLAVVFCFALVACDNPADSGTTSSTTQSSSDSTSETTSSSSTTESSSVQEFPEAPEGFTALPVSDDLEMVSIGKYVTLRYNGAAADVFYKVEKGIGSRENVTLKVSPKNGYTFDGWSQNEAMVNGMSASSADTTHTFQLDANSKYKDVNGNWVDLGLIFLNSSATLNYNANGGTFSGGFKGSETFSVMFFHNPSTKIAGNSFKRDGYTLIGYNTKADGTGDFVSLGERVNIHGKGEIDLYCVWSEHTPADQFTYSEVNGNIIITKYKGSAETVSIPDKINGKTVKQISTGAFQSNSKIKTVVIPKTLISVDSGAFNNCSSLTTVILFDSLTNVSDGSFKNCKALETVHINTSYQQINQWMSYGAAKIDRLMWAKDKKKIIIVGGSGSYYGFDSAVIDQALGGEYEIVNLGENANVASLTYFDLIEEYICEGDIVLWCPEPGSYTMGSYAAKLGSRFWEFRKADFGTMQYLNLSYYSGFFSSFASSCTTLAGYGFKKLDCLTKDSFKYGDCLADRAHQPDKVGSNPYSFNYTLTETAAYSELFTNIQNKGGKIFFSFAAMAQPLTDSSAPSAAAAFEAQITSLPNVTSISAFEDCLYDYTYLSDSAWHLTDEGATLRSERVAADLLKALGKTAN